MSYVCKYVHANIPPLTHKHTHTYSMQTSVYLSNLGHQRPFDQSNVYVCLYIANIRPSVRVRIALHVLVSA